MSKEIKGKVAREYRKKYPDAKQYALAKIMCMEMPHIFKSRESARDVLRYIEGNKGIQDRKKVIDKSAFKELIHDTSNGLKIVSKAPKLKTFTLPTSIKEVLFLSDIHIPYQDDLALNLAIKYGVDNKVDCIWLNGDIMDMYQASDHEKLPSHAELKEEIEMTREFLANLRAIFPKATIYYKEGNHERRWLRMLMKKAPELIGCEEFELPVILKFAEHKIIWIENETLTKFGKLNVLHGNEFKGSGGVNPARALYMRAKSNAIAGDKHKTGENTEGSLDGKIVTTWAVGCLCDLNPKYMPFAHASWNLGFAHIKMNGKEFHVDNKRIYNGRIL